MRRGLLTPLRIILLAVLLSFLTFVWTFGLSSRRAEPVVPIAHHKEAVPHGQEKEAAPLSAHAKPGYGQPRPHSTSSTITRVGRTSLIPSSTPSKPPKSTPQPHKKASTSLRTPKQVPASTVSSARAPYPTSLNGTLTNATLPAPKTTCRDVPGASDITLLYSISKSTQHHYLPAHLATLFTCAPHVLVFSDHAGYIGNHTVHDALEGIFPETKSRHDEFKAYEKQKQAAVPIPPASAKSLERWKILPMLYKAYTMRPESKWFLLLEPDTSLSWTNLAQWTARLDPRIPYYAGAPLQLGGSNGQIGVRFAQRSPGVLLSNAALERFVKLYGELYNDVWEPRVATEGLSDVVLAQAMQDSNVELSNAHPMLRAQKPWEVGWERKYWCTPAVSYHRQTLAELEERWNAETNWTAEKGFKEAYLHRDAFTDIIFPELVNEEVRENWDNGAEGTTIAQPLLDTFDAGEMDRVEWYEHESDIRQAVVSWQSCQKVCELAEDCQQWKYTKTGNGECVLGKNIKLGAKAAKDDEELWISGWVAERIYNTTVEWKCDSPNWRFSQ